MTRVLWAAMALALAFSSSTSAATKLKWSYEGFNGPENWSFIDTDYLACARGMQQSPIDLSGAINTVLGSLELFWNVADWDLKNTGTTLRLTATDPGYAIIEGTRYELKEIDFHTPSEHAIDGQHFPMEAQFMHKAEDGRMAVVSVMFTGGGRNDAFEAVMARAPVEAHDMSVVSALDPIMLVTDLGDLFRYQGSLTTPPCSEEVEWTILMDPLEVSDAALFAFSSLYRMNARPLQPLNRRYVLTD